ncbi:MAG TPA: 2-oxo acid dehydrogenase subunit E2 [Armatimonadaceae bacterium]|nr:2-oxo acid dehydrogenase subunit E2 [Armatimonadaceae bacterium]
MAHLPLGETQELTTYRKIAIAAWRHPRDPSTYSWLDLPVEAAEAFLKTFPGGAGAPPRPSLTHYIAKIVAHCLEEHPELNHLLRRDRLQRRQRTDVFITTLLKTASAADLSGFPIRDAARLSLAEIARLSADAVDRLRDGTDDATVRTARVTARLPVWLLRLAMRAQDFAHFTLNVSLRPFGLPDDRFGSVMISNFGVLGIDNALVPLSPYCRTPLMIGVGRPRPIPVARGGEVVVAECVTISFTFDHRYADGVHGGLLMRQFQKIFLNPHRYPAVFAGVSAAAADAQEAAVDAAENAETLSGAPRPAM